MYVSRYKTPCKIKPKGLQDAEGAARIFLCNIVTDPSDFLSDMQEKIF